MLNISTNKWHLKDSNDGSGGATLNSQLPYRVVFVSSQDIPDLRVLHKADERTFDDLMEKLFQSSGPSFSRD